MKKLIPVILILTLFITSPANAGNLNQGTDNVNIPGGPRFWVHDTDRDVSVTIKGDKFPLGDTRFSVYIGKPGNAFGRGEYVGFLHSTSEGFTRTYKIPDKMKGQTNLALLIQNNDDGSHGYLIFSNTDGFDSSELVSLIPVHHSSSQTNGTSVAIFDGPTYWIKDVVKDTSFNMRVVDHFNEDTYAVYIDENTSDFRGIFIGRIVANDPYRFHRTFNIPASLAGVEELKVVMENIFNGHSGSTAFTNVVDWDIVSPAGFFSTFFISLGGGASSQSARSTPFTNILNVVTDGEVTLQTFNFPANTNFVVTMGPVGTQGIGGIVIGTQNSGNGGSFIATYPIPSQLRGSEMISIRLQSTTSGHFSYDFFKNQDGFDASSSGVVFDGNWTLPIGTYPYTTVNAVVADSSVTVTGSNFTKNDVYTVRMGAFGTQGVNGIIAGTQAIDGSGNFTASFTIPSALLGTPQIAIRFESNNTAYYAYDWFYNVTSGP